MATKKTKTKTKKPVTLPDKLSELLRLAVKDCQKVEKMKTRTLDMSTWHERDYDGNKCVVCMAGAVMDRTLRLNDREELSPEDAKGTNAGKLYAIDSMRGGHLPEAFNDIDVTFDNDDLADDFFRIVGTDYSDSRSRASWRTYLRAAKLLEAHGY